MTIAVHPAPEELDLYLQGRLSDLQVAAMEAHLEVCDLCAARCEAMTAGRMDRRHEPRTLADEPASLQVLHPLSLDNLNVRVRNTSKSGMAVRCATFIAPGSEVKVRVGDTINFGQVRYCIEVEDEFQAGIKIRDIF